MGSGAPGGAGGAGATGGVVSGSFLVADEPEPEAIRGSGVAGAIPQTGEGGRPHGGVHGRARSGLILREPAQDALSGQTAEVGSQAGSEDGGRGSPPQRSPVPAESAGVRDPALGSGADGAGDASGLESASFSRAGVASGESGAASGEAIDFRHQSRGDGLEAVLAETGARILGAGIVDSGGIGPAEGTETVGISGRKVNLSAGDSPPGRYTVYDWFNRPVFEPIQSNRQRFKRNWAPTARKRRTGSPYQHVP